MKIESLEYYLYEKRYLSFSEKRLKSQINFKGKILEFLYKRDSLFKNYAHWERFILNRQKWLKRHHIFIEDKLKREKYNYTEIELKNISFFEVIEIDDFDKFRKKLLSKFGDSTGVLGINRKEDVQEKLYNLENKFDNISWGDLFTINYKSSNSRKNDFIESISCRFIKTYESYFIISFDIQLSEKAKEIMGKIFQQSDVGLSFPSYNSYLKIFKEKMFYNKTTFARSLKAFNYQNFISDLSSQVKNNVTHYFNGYFQKSKIFNVLPCTQLYEVADINQFKSDSNLAQLYRESFGKYYSLDDKQIEIHFPNTLNFEKEEILIFRQKGHTNDKMFGNDLSDWDDFERFQLIRSLSFPCVFSGIIKEQNLKLNKLKREIYDQIKSSGNQTIIKHLFLLGSNNKYLKLKHKSIQIQLTINRFENDFTNENIKFYTEGFSLEEFKPRNYKNLEEKNLLEYFVESFRFQINYLKEKTSSLNEIFKSLEEFNSYKTNFILQLFSIFIGVLAFIFAFDKTKEFIYDIVKLIFK